MKKIFALLICLLIMLSTVFPVNASEKKLHTIESAHFDVLLNEDGSADITETWVVTFVSGEFSRFRKEIYLKVTDLERFASVTNISVSIDGEQCEESETNGFNCVTTDDTFIIYANKASENITRTYTFSYTLTDVVKKIDDNTSKFSYRFVGKNHTINIDELTITITAPFSGSFNTEYLTRGTEMTQDSVIQYHTKDSLGLFKVTLAFDSAQAFGVPYTSSHAASADSDDGAMILIILLLNPMVWFTVWGIYKIVKSSNDASQARNQILANQQEAARHPEQMEPLIETLGESFTACQIASIFMNRGGSIKILTVILAELVLSGHITLTDNKDGMVLNTDLPDPQLPHQLECLRIIRDAYSDFAKHFQHDPCARIESLPFSYFAAYVVSHAETLRDRFKLLRSFLGYDYLIRNNPQNRHLASVVEKLLAHLQIQKFEQTSFSELLSSAKDGKLATLTTMAYMCCKFSTDESYPIDLSLTALSGISAQWFDTQVSTNSSDSGCSSCSSCSSCSGCSGCAGCGGD